jgi:molecular chaperone GrpE
MADREQQNEKDKNVIEFEPRTRSGGEKAEVRPGETSEEGAETSAADERLARLQAEKDELMQSMVRRQADFENYRKRIERERQDDRRHGVGRLIEELLPVLDSFERALKAHDDPAYEEYRKGLELIYLKLWDTLARHGLERITAAGKAFDPNYHQAIERVDSDEHPDGTVLEVLQDGFIYHGRVIRPSIVRVSHNAGQPEGGKSSAAQRHGK